MTARCTKLSTREHPRSRAGLCWRRNLKLERVVLSVGIEGGREHLEKRREELRRCRGPEGNKV